MDTSLDGRKCEICGATIGDCNVVGIGGGCMKNVVYPARNECFREVMGLEVWKAKVELVQNKFLSEFSDVKFRSAFKKSFFESMQTAERISKKQLDIMVSWLEYKFIRFNFWEDVEKPMREAFDPMIACADMYASKIDYHKKLYLSGRKNAA